MLHSENTSVGASTPRVEYQNISLAIKSVTTNTNERVAGCKRRIREMPNDPTAHPAWLVLELTSTGHCVLKTPATIVAYAVKA